MARDAILSGNSNLKRKEIKKLQSFFDGRHFKNEDGRIENVFNCLMIQAVNLYEVRIQTLVPRYDKGLQNFGGYVEN
ncbi:hypothetical protein J6590_071940 [Homalodisca vitripennis]|nr:hypothetical protein J6590_071940 [Homalodisca vitripennis]